MLPGNQMDGVLEREVTIASEHMPDQLLSNTEMVTMDFATLKEKISMTWYHFMGEENRIFLLYTPIKAENFHILWYQKLLELSLFSVYKGEKFSHIGNKMYNISAMKQAWKSKL